MTVRRDEYLSDVWRDGIFSGAGTICSAQVRALVHLGANACIVGRNTEKTERMAADIASARAGAKVLGIGGLDVRSLASLQDATERCVKELGSIDFLIAGAAGNFLAPVTQLSANAFKSVVDIDLLGSYNTVKATLPYLFQSAAKHKAPNSGTGGRIIFLSTTIHYTGQAMQAHVSAAKAGVDALSQSLAIEMAPRGMTSNVIAPGAIAGTEGLERLAQLQDDAQASEVVRRIPTGRWGTVKDIANATVWLFSSAGDYVNGATIVVDGGAWRVPGTGPGAGFPYPDFLLSDSPVTGVKAAKTSKL